MVIAALNPYEFALAITAPATFVYLVLLFLAIRLSRSPEQMLIVSGLLTAVFAAWCSLASAEGAVQVRAGQAGIVFGNEAAGVLGRIAVLLILCGLAVIILHSGTVKSPLPAQREEGIRE